MGQRDTETMNSNKVSLFRLYSACLPMYLKSCRVLGQQPDSKYLNGMLITVVPVDATEQKETPTKQ
jgi:hypothetical protein